MERLSLVVPVVTLRAHDGQLDLDALDDYAAVASRTSVDRFLLSGSTGLGAAATTTERAVVLDVWRRRVAPHRLVAACWDDVDMDHAQRAGVWPMLVLTGQDEREQETQLRYAAEHAVMVYSHPRYGVPLSLDLLCRLRPGGWLPTGAKVSGWSVAGMRDVRAVVGPEFVLWHGSARNIRSSLYHGADGVVAAVLACMPRPFPPADVDSVQQAVNRLRGEQPEPADRVWWLCTRTRRRIAHG